MHLTDVHHPEDIKAAIRKRYRSLAAFERAEGLARQSVSEILRGRPSRRTESAIQRVLREQEKTQSIKAGDNEPWSVTHRLNAEAR